MTSTAKATAATSLDTSAIVDAAEIDASDVTTPFSETATNIDEARETVSVSATDTHVKTLDDALTAGTGVTITKTNSGADESLTIAADGANIGSLDAGNISAGVVAHERGGLEADVSAYSGLVKISGGATSQAAAGTDYVSPGGAETLTNKTLTTPTIGDFTNAGHNHQNAAGGGKLTEDAINSGAATSGHVLTANGSGGASWAAAGGGGAAPIDITVTAGETLAERDMVFVDVSAGTAKKIDTDATTPLAGTIRGVVNEAGGIASAATGTVRIAGEVSGFTGLTAWTDVYASTTAGGYTQTKPAPTDGGGQVAVLPMGYAVSTTAIMVQPRPAQYLKRETLADAASTTITHHSDPAGRGRRVRAYVATSASATVADYGSANQDSNVTLRAVVGYSADGLTGGTASASTVFGTDVAANTVDANASTYWQSNEAGSGDPATWKYDLGAGNGVAFSKYTLQARADGTRYPIDWTFAGSNDDASYTTLDTQTSQSFTSGESKDYTFVNTTVYRYYRFVFTSAAGSGGSQYTTIAEISAFEATSNDKLAQSFQVTGTTTIDKASLWLKKVGVPTGTMTLRIETDSAGEPSGTLADANATATLAESGLGTSYGWAEFDFATNFSLSGSTTYWLVLSTDRTASASNYVECGADGSTPGYASGEMKSEASSSWSAESKDAVFEVYEASTAYDEPVVVGRSSGGTRDVGARFDDGSGSDGNTKTTFTNTMGTSADLTMVVELD